MKSSRYADSHATTVELVEDWRERAACVGQNPEWWYADAKDAKSIANARAALLICQGQCPVRQECLDAALKEEVATGRSYRFGIRGGLTASQRARRFAPKRKPGKPRKEAT